MKKKGFLYNRLTVVFNQDNSSYKLVCPKLLLVNILYLLFYFSGKIFFASEGMKPFCHFGLTYIDILYYLSLLSGEIRKMSCGILR